MTREEAERELIEYGQGFDNPFCTKTVLYEYLVSERLARREAEIDVATERICRREAEARAKEAESNAWKNKQYAETMRAMAEKAEARVKEYEGMKVHPDNACSGCRKTFAENYGADWLCDDCKKAYRQTFLRSRQEALEEAAKVAERECKQYAECAEAIRSLKEKK